MRTFRNYDNPSNTKSINKEKARELQDEINFFIEEKKQDGEEIDISKTKIYKPITRRQRGNEYKHHKIK